MSGTIKIDTASGTIISNKRELVKYDDPILKNSTQAWNFNNPPMNLMQLANELVDCLKENNGLGLSCPQVGLPYRIFIIGAGNNFIIINPIVLEVSSEVELLEEGCLTFPGLRLMIRRPIRVHFHYYDINGRFNQTKFEGLSARIFCHEFDHLNGKPFTQRCSKLKLEMAIQKAAKNNHIYKIKELI